MQQTLTTFFFLLCNLQMASATTSNSQPPEWTVLYHFPGKFKGRGEFLRLMLEDAGQSYANTADNLYGPEGMMDMFRGSVEAVANDSKEYPPLLFPPAIWHRPPPNKNNQKPPEPVLINQVGACMIYLGEQLGYAPESPAERARADAVMLNCLDYIAEGRSSFHPVQNSMSYKDQKEQGDKVSKEFSQERMKKYLLHFNKVVAAAAAAARRRQQDGSSTPQPVAGGDKITYADFALFHVLDATIHQFNTDFYEKAWDNTNVPALKEYHAWFVASRPKLKAYFESDRCAPYAGDSMM